MAQLIPSTTPIRALEDHGDRVIALAVFHVQYTRDERMVTGSYDGMLRLWDLKTGEVLKKMEGHRSRVRALAVSQDGKWIASGEPLTPAIEKAHAGCISSLDFSLNNDLASGSSDTTTKLWNISTWQVPYHSFDCGGNVRCVRYSRIHDRLAIATDHNIQIYHPEYCWRLVATIHEGFNYSLAWTSDEKRLFSGGNGADPTIREWDTSTWWQVGDPWKGHFENVLAISLNYNGTLLASASDDNRVRLWRVSDRRTIAIFKHSGGVNCVAFSKRERHILSGGVDKKISEWPASEDALPEDGLKDGLIKEQATHQAEAYFDVKVLAINSTARNVSMVEDWPSAEQAINSAIGADANDHIAYANRAFVMARKHDWDHALYDAIQSVRIQPSLAGHIFKGIALCGKKQVQAARISFDLASLFTNGDLKIDHFVFLIKAISLFNANEHQEAILRVGELAACPNVDPVACRIVEAYLRVQLGNIALDGARYNEAVEHFAAAANASAFFYKFPIHLTHEAFVVLFGWDLKSLWQTANQQQCHALFRAASYGAAIESYQSMMDKIDEDMKADLRAWFTALK